MNIKSIHVVQHVPPPCGGMRRVLCVGEDGVEGLEPTGYGVVVHPTEVGVPWENIVYWEGDGGSVGYMASAEEPVDPVADELRELALDVKSGTALKAVVLAGSEPGPSLLPETPAGCLEAVTAMLQHQDDEGNPEPLITDEQALALMNAPDGGPVAVPVDEDGMPVLAQLPGAKATLPDPSRVGKRAKRKRGK